MMFAQRSGLRCAARGRRPVEAARGALVVLSLLAAVTVSFPGQAQAADTYWDANAGNWSDANNWSAGEPNANVNAIISNGGTATITEANEACRDLYVGKLASETGSVVVSSGSLNTKEAYIGSSGDGNFTQTGGEVSTNSFHVGGEAGSVGRYELHDGNLIFEGDNWYVGEQGAGTFIQYGGTHTIDCGFWQDVYLGYGPNSVGHYELHDGNLLVSYPNSVWVGKYGTGSFIQYGGTHKAGFQLLLGGEANSLATYQMQGGSLTTGGLTVSSGGTFTQTGGDVSASYFNVSGSTDSVATYELYDGNLTVRDSYVFIGRNGAGRLIQYGGTLTAGEWYGTRLLVGDNTGQSGTYELRGGSLILLGSGTSIIVGNYGQGTFVQAATGTSLNVDTISVGNYGQGTYIQNGGDLSVGLLELGRYAGSVGRFEYHDGNLSFNTLTIGRDGNGTFVQYANDLLFNTFTLGTNIGSEGCYELHDGNLYVSSSPWIGYEGRGVFTQTGGTCHVWWRSLFLGVTPTGHGTCNLQGGVLLPYDTWVGSEGTGVFVQTGGYHRPYRLYVGDRGDGTYELHDGNLTVYWYFHVGCWGKGTFIQYGGTSEVECALNIGLERYLPGPAPLLDGNLTAEGTYVLHDGSLHTGKGTTVGGDTRGTFTQSGGSHAAYSLCVGLLPDGNGLYELSAGSLHVETDERIGNEGLGRFIQTGGAHEVGGYLLVGDGPSGIGSYALDDGNLTTGGTRIGIQGNGAFTQAGGLHTIVGELCVGREPNSAGAYVLADGNLVVGHDATIGFDGNGAFTQTGGTFALGDDLWIGWGADSTGAYEMQDGSLAVRAVFVGMAGTGTFTQTGGGVSVEDDLHIGWGPASQGTCEIQGGVLAVSNVYAGYYGYGTLTQTGGEVSVTGHLYVGYCGDGNFAKSGGDLFVAGDLIVGWGSGTRGHGELHDGNLTVSGDTRVGLDGQGTFMQYGGTHTIGGDLWLGGAPNSIGDYGFYGGRLAVHGTIVSPDGNRAFIQTTGDVFIDHLGVDSQQPNTIGSYEISGGTATIDDMTVGSAGEGWFTQTDGNVCGTYLFLGGEPNSAGHYALLGGSLTLGTHTHVGTNGHGTFTQHGGTHGVRWLYVGAASTARGIYQIDDGNLTVGVSLKVGNDGNGTFLQNGGHVSVGGLCLGYDDGSDGRYELTDGNLVVGGGTALGQYGGLGSFIQTGGRAFIGGELCVGCAADAEGICSLYSGGSLSVVGVISVGGYQGGVGSMFIYGGTLRAGNIVRIWSTGSMVLGGGTLAHADSNLHVDIENDGLLHVTAGGHTLGHVVSIDANVLGTTQLDAGSSLSVTEIVQDTLTIGAGATLTIRGSSATTSIINNLSIDAANGGQLDLDDSYDGKGNMLVLPGATYATVAGLVQSGRNGGTGVWDGAGIVTSVGQDSNNPVAVGVIDNAQFTYTTFGDATGLDGNEVLLKCTWNGDADLKNGTETFDLLRWLDGYNAVGTGWAYGDFDYDGDTDIFDLLNWLDGYNATQSYGVMVMGPDGGETPIPEPATLALLALGGAALLRRGSRRLRAVPARRDRGR
ncbi:MAG TPA: PEP-CTERM sorting domain-containing protein [Phycisphaerae bacterium]|nr:PEP-CTERM sorting domain-containing protein [Phycisphaerae bacterium]